MQVAFFAMTTQLSTGQRLISSWQVDAAKRAVDSGFAAARQLASQIKQAQLERRELVGQDQLACDRIEVTGDLAEISIFERVPSTPTKDRLRKEALAVIGTNWLNSFDPEHIARRSKGAIGRPALKPNKPAINRFVRAKINSTMLGDDAAIWLDKVGTPPPVKLFGRVVFFNQLRGYGFIRPDGGGQDVFLSLKGLPKGTPLPKDDQRCAFVLVNGKKGPFAKDFVSLHV
jgi:cold shock CspA family protein